MHDVAHIDIYSFTQSMLTLFMDCAICTDIGNVMLFYVKLMTYDVWDHQYIYIYAYCIVIGN